MNIRVQRFLVLPLAAVGAIGLVGWLTSPLFAETPAPAQRAAQLNIELAALPTQMPPAAAYHVAETRQAAPRHDRLQTEVLVGTRAYGGAERVALPAGTRFRLRLSATTEGVVQIVAINPAGAVHGELWRGVVTAGDTTLTPRFRLQGQRGLETLQVRFVPIGGSRAASVQTLRLWHL